MTARRKSLSPRRRLAIWRRDRFTCTYCGINAMDSDVPLEVDHRIPVVAGGSNDDDNLTTACRPCNAKKGPPPTNRKKPRRPLFTEAELAANAAKRAAMFRWSAAYEARCAQMEAAGIPLTHDFIRAQVAQLDAAMEAAS